MSTPSHAPTRSAFGMVGIAILLAGFLAFPPLLPAQTAAPIDPATGLPTAATPAANFVPGRIIGMRPEEKRPLLLKASERNPYAKRSDREEITGEENIDAEEQQIRARLGSLAVTGRSEGPNGLRILLGDIILEQGRILPQLLEDQSENLKVLAISDDTVVLGWIDLASGEASGKTMQVSYDLSPRVSYALHGQESPAAEEGGGERRMGVLHPGRPHGHEKSAPGEATSADDGKPEQKPQAPRDISQTEK